jgi:membrane protease YdiL (CAAX protease family)
MRNDNELVRGHGAQSLGSCVGAVSDVFHASSGRADTVLSNFEQSSDTAERRSDPPMTSPLPPPIAGTAVAPAIPPPVLPVASAAGAMAVLTASLIVSKYLLEATVELRWPLAVYVSLLAVVGYGPSLWWCRYVSRRWGSGDLGADIGLEPRLADLAWGPMTWLAAIAAQIVIGAVVVALGVPLVGNTEGISEISADRTYVVSLVVTAVIAAPIVEEMVFRGVVLRGLRSRLPVVPAICLQGALFGIAHVDPVRGRGNVGLVMVLSGVGIAFGVAAVLLGRIGPSIVAHAIFNGAVLLIVLTGVADRLQDDAVPSGTREQVGVVDQADLAEAHGECDPDRAGPAVIGDDVIDRTEGGAVEHGNVVELCQRLGVDDRLGRVDHQPGVGR